MKKNKKEETMDDKKKSAVKKMRGKILMGGSIGIAGPGILELARKKEGDSFYEVDHVEFNLKVEGAEKFTFTELNPFFDLSAADIDILTEARDDNQICDSFTVEFHDGQERELEIIFSVDQVRALAEILQSYIVVHDSWSRLQEPVRAAGSKD
jgi:hypothetical protein